MRRVGSLFGEINVIVGSSLVPANKNAALSSELEELVPLAGFGTEHLGLRRGSFVALDKSSAVA